LAEKAALISLTPNDAQFSPMDEAREIAVTQELKPTPTPPKGGLFGWLLWVLVFFLVAYPLSIGPAAKFHQHFPGARPSIEAAYKPIVVLMEHSPAARAGCMWYLSKIWNVDD
jgi:hypothetical protein